MPPILQPPVTGVSAVVLVAASHLLQPVGSVSPSLKQTLATVQPPVIAVQADWSVAGSHSLQVVLSRSPDW